MNLGATLGRTLLTGTLLCGVGAQDAQQQRANALYARVIRESVKNDAATLATLIDEIEQFAARDDSGWNQIAILLECIGTSLHYQAARGGRVDTLNRRVAAIYARALDERDLATLEVTRREARHMAEAALAANDLKLTARALQLARAHDDDTFIDRALLHVAAIKLQCRLGRLEKAALEVPHARKLASSAIQAAERSGNEAAVAIARQCQLAVEMATFDLHMLDSNFARARKVLAKVDDPRAKVYRALLDVVTGDPKDEPGLLAMVKHGRGPRRLLMLTAAKLTQASLRRADVDEAATRLAELCKLSPVASGDDEARSAQLALAVALQRRQVDEALLADANKAFAIQLQRFAQMPRLAGGSGLLQMSDHATLLSNLMLAETTATADEAGRIAAFEHVLRAQATAIQSKPLTADAVRQRLLTSDGHGLLLFVPGRFATCLLCIDRAQISVHTLPSAPELRERGDELRAAAHAALREPQHDARLAKAALAASNDLLPADVQQRIRAYDRLSICGASMLQNAPLELLRLPDSDRPLGLRLPIDYVANLVTGAKLAPARARDRAPLFAGSLRGTAGGENLRMPDGATDGLRAYAERAESLLDERATPAAVIERLRHAPVAHLVGHGVRDFARDYEHAIAFANTAEQTLWGEQLVDLDLDGLVAILGSCGAGDAPLRRGGEALGASLAGAMLSAGARCVLVPTTDVAIGNHLGLATHIHRQLAAGESPAIALWRARIEVAGERKPLLEALLMQAHGRGFAP